MLELITGEGLSPIARGVIAFLIAFGVSLAIGNKVILKLISMKLGQPVRSKEEVNELFDLHGSKAGTPTMGGVMIIAMIVLSVFLCADLTNPYIHVCMFVLLGLGALGFKDDFAKISQGNSKGVSSKFKLVWQFGVAAIATAWIFFAFDFYPNIELQVEGILLHPDGSGEQMKVIVEDNGKGMIYLPIINQSINISWMYLAFGIVVLVGASNAVNLTDGLDGLASGCTITTAGVYTFIAVFASYGVGSSALAHPAAVEMSVFCLAMVGAVCGFLWFNAYPARVFMGDTGSLAIGGALGTVAMCTKQELLLVVIGFVFVAEALSVMTQVSYYKFTKKKFGEGKRLLKCAPIHHHFELSGWKETQVITRFWIVSGICGGVGLAILFI